MTYISRIKTIYGLITLLAITGSASAQADVDMRFDQPARRFTQSCPLGNGHMGAMVFGDPSSERIVLNDISLWSGGVEDPDRPDAYQYLQPIRQLLLEGKNV